MATLISARSLIETSTLGWSRITPKTENGPPCAPGHEIAWEFESAGGPYTGRMLIDGEIYTPAEATKKFLSQD